MHLIELIQEKRVSDENKNIAVFQGTDGDIQILNGRFGPYIVYNKQNYRIPKGKEVKELTLDDCLEIIKNSPEKPPRKKGK